MPSEDRLGRDAIDDLLGRVARQRPPESAKLRALPELRSEMPGARGHAAGSDKEPALARGLLDAVRLRVRVELGRKRMQLDEALGLESGSVVELDATADSPVTIWVGDTAIARGEVLVVDDRFCVRITEVVEPERSEE